MKNEPAPGSNASDDELIAWWTFEHAIASRNVAQLEIDLALAIRSCGLGACEAQRTAVDRYSRIVCEARAVIFADLH
jgi:hypothetical protein